MLGVWVGKAWVHHSLENGDTIVNERRKALVVGIDSYGFLSLEGCVSDSVKIGNLLQRHGNQNPNFDVKRLLSSTDNITQGILKEEIDSLFSGAPDTALLYFSGHGFVNNYGGYLVTSDFKKYEEGVSMSEIIRLANQSKAKNKVIILDCCYSGSLAKPSVGQGSTVELSDGLTVLTACGENEHAEEDANGVFSSLLIEALEGRCADLTGHILPSSIYAYIDRALGFWNRQRPIFRTNVSRFTSLREVDPPIDFSVLRQLLTYFPSAEVEYPLTPSHEFTHPDADSVHVEAFRALQKMESVGLVLPVGEEHMYFAAINSKSCRLTTLGKQYWKLIESNRI